MSAIFGPAGSAEDFLKKYKASSDMPKYLSEMGLDAFEYQCGQGVRVTDASAQKLKANAEEYGITLSLHAPYFISLSSVEPEKRDKSIDFGHLNARTLGGVNSKEAFEQILDGIENKLGSDRLKCFHSHFSKIEYTQKGGELKHLTFEDSVFGPEYEPLMELIAKKQLSPTFICESAGTQSFDALAMKKSYLSFLE